MSYVLLSSGKDRWNHLLYVYKHHTACVTLYVYAEALYSNEYSN